MIHTGPDLNGSVPTIDFRSSIDDNSSGSAEAGPGPEGFHRALRLISELLCVFSLICNTRVHGWLSPSNGKVLLSLRLISIWSIMPFTSSINKQYLYNASVISISAFLNGL